MDGLFIMKQDGEVRLWMTRPIYLYPSGRMTYGGVDPPIPGGWGVLSQHHSIRTVRIFDQVRHTGVLLPLK
jgi:hypothetical protein